MKGTILVMLAMGLAFASQAGRYSCSGDGCDVSDIQAAGDQSRLASGAEYLLSKMEPEGPRFGRAFIPSDVGLETQATGADVASSRARSWTALFVDAPLGSHSPVAKDFSLEVSSPVPEPVDVALAIFGGLVVLVLAGGSRPVRLRWQRMRAAIADWINAV